MAGWQVQVKVVCGRGLVARDLSGRSDPYVKVEQGATLLHTTEVVPKSLEPDWNEQFSSVITDTTVPLTIKAYDYDRASGDDRLGQAVVDLPSPEEGSREVTVQLTPGEEATLERLHSTTGLGTVTLRMSVALNLQEAEDTAVGSFMAGVLRSPTRCPSKVSFSKPAERSGVVRVVVVQARGLLPPPATDTVTSYCKVQLGGRTLTTSTISSFSPQWKQGFSLPWYEGRDDFVELSVVSGGEKEGIKLGRASVDLRVLEREETHQLWLHLEERQGAPTSSLLGLMEGSIHIMATITGTTTKPELPDIQNKGLPRVRSEHVGVLRVSVLRAEGLQPEGLMGRSSSRNPYTVLEVGNSWRQTQTIRGTLNPSWDRTVHFNIPDMTEVLDVTIYDEEDDKDDEDAFLGTVSLPLLRIVPGQQWIFLKDPRRRKPAGGSQPRILLHLQIEYSRVKACQHLFRPVATKYDGRNELVFDLATFRTNAKRLKRVTEGLSLLRRKVGALFHWEDPFKSSYALVTYVVAVTYLDLWALPLLPILWITYHWFHPPGLPGSLEEVAEEERRCEDCDANIPKDEEPEDSWRISGIIKEVTQKAVWMQEMMGSVTDTAERFQNLLNCTVPLVSVALLGSLSLLMVLLNLVPLRWIILYWGVNKFWKGLLGSKPTQGKLGCLLARVPHSQDLLDCEELPGGDLDRRSVRQLRSRASCHVPNI